MEKLMKRVYAPPPPVTSRYGHSSSPISPSSARAPFPDHADVPCADRVGECLANSEFYGSKPTIFCNRLVQALEEQLWELAVTVRDQDSKQGLALSRCARLRRVLDLRMYDIMLLRVRTRLVWGGTAEDSSSQHEDCQNGI